MTGTDEFETTLREASAGDPEVSISLDLARRGLIAAPVLIGLAFLIWGRNGAYSAAFAVALVIVNFLLSAALIAFASRISVGAVMGAVMLGYLMRLGLILVAILLVREQSWISLPALGVGIIVTHLGLLMWELRQVSLTLAYPGLKPAKPSA